MDRRVDRRAKKTKEGFGLRTVLLVALLSVVVGAGLSISFDLETEAVAGEFWKESANGKAMATVPDKSNFVHLARTLSPTVVNISTTQKISEKQTLPFPEFKNPFFDDFFGDDFKKFFDNGQERERKRHSLGSGFIINPEGYIITNYHVTDNASEIIVTLSESKKEYEAKVIGKDQKLDIALIKIETKEKLAVATLGDSEALQVGEWVVAIGNPFGLGGTVTAGIVSQKGRVIGAGPYDNFIQTDASINPGNSGGPLFNMKGEVVGVNTAIIAGGQGIGFTIPVNTVKDILVQLKERGHVTRGWIGVSIQSLTPELAKSFGLKAPDGALISSVNVGDPAEKAGIKAGDIVVSFNGKKIDEYNDLPRVVASTVPGKRVAVKVVRDGKSKSLFITVGTKNEGTDVAAAGPDTEKNGPGAKLGITVQPLDTETARRLGVRDTTTGVYISYVRAGSIAASAGLKRGDVIREINRKTITDKKSYDSEISKAKKELLFLIKRGRSTVYVVLNFNGK
ncbi:MAG: Do family serine endopeptidase [Proteobacteria bacterium]|nr:Do family serine endopeptidase [Pseudomonadota bacterium]